VANGLARLRVVPSTTGATIDSREPARPIVVAGGDRLTVTASRRGEPWRSWAVGSGAWRSSR
jgi:hypothetical protein